MDKNLEAWKTYLGRVTALSNLSYNYEGDFDDNLNGKKGAKKFEDLSDRMGWTIDRYRAHLAKEAPGEPVKGGPFEKAKQAVRDYRFPDPRLIQGYFDPEKNLEGRDMLLRAKFLGFTFFFGTRINHVIDDVETNEIGNRSQVWGYSYRTLQGHFEMGEMRFEVWKDLETGEVSFQIDAYSKPGRIANPLYRLGFHIFGRGLQRYFAHSAMDRMQAIAGNE